MHNDVTVRYSTEQKAIVVAKSFTICIDVDGSDMSRIEKFKSWIREYRHGSFDEIGNIICESSTDYVACQLKAKALKLLPEVPTSALAKRISSGSI